MKITRRSIFVKIFLWFWVAMILALISTTIVVVFFPSQAVIVQMKNYFSFNLSTVGKIGADIYETSGSQAVEDFLGQIDTISTFRLHMVSSQREPLRSKPLPEKSYTIIQNALADANVHFQDVFIHPLIAVRALSGSGKHYVIILELPRGLVQFFFGISTGQAAKALTAVIVTGLVCLLLARYLTAPIRQLQSAVRRFARGDMAVRVGPVMGDRQDEIGDLGKDFDTMAAQIESLVDAHEELLRDVAHELRSPLTRLNVALEITRKHTGKETKRYIDRIGQEADKLSQLITQLLTWSRLENSDVAVQMRPVALEDIISRIAKDADFEGQMRNCTVSFSCQEKCMIEVDGTLIRSALENVVRNALRFTPDGTEVEIAQKVIHQNGTGQAVVIIKDFGHGVSADALDDLFKPFFKANHPQNRSSGGTGLGLAIAHRAVTLHHGRIAAENRPGGGLIVEIQLPLRSGNQTD